MLARFEEKTENIYTDRGWFVEFRKLWRMGAKAQGSAQFAVDL